MGEDSIRERKRELGNRGRERCYKFRREREMKCTDQIDRRLIHTEFIARRWRDVWKLTVMSEELERKGRECCAMHCTKMR